MDAKELLHTSSNNFESVFDNMDMFLKDPDSIVEGMLGCTKQVSDFIGSWQNIDGIGLLGHHHVEPNSTSSLKRLYLNNFDLEQVWQMIKINNEIATESGYFLANNNRNNKKLRLKEHQQQPQMRSISKEESLSETKVSFGTANGLQQSEEKLPLSSTSEKDVIIYESMNTCNKEKVFGDNYPKHFNKERKSVVDDGFFVLEEMNRFLDQEDKKENRKNIVDTEVKNDDSDNDIEYFNNSSSDNSDDLSTNHGTSDVHIEEAAKNERNLMFADFFDQPNIGIKDRKEKLPVQEDINSEINMSEDEDELSEKADSSEDSSIDESKLEDKENEEQSRFEMESKKMQNVIKHLEKENLGKKRWQTVGEVSASKRPKNSLLEEHLTFDQHLVGASTITEETTLTLEDLIKQRIKDEAWDDVTRKIKPAEKPEDYKKALELNHEKSKISLAEVYEKEYIKQTEEKEDEEANPAHEAIKSMMSSLFSKLNALSNFTYTPKQPTSELKIISNLPSLQIEENTPVAASNDQLLAPEEIYSKTRKEAKGETEKTSTDKRHERRDKKAIKKQKIKDRAKRAKQGNHTSDSKNAALKTVLKNSKNSKITGKDVHVKDSLKSSSKFFSQLQENIQDGRKGEKDVRHTKKRKSAVNIKL